MRPHNKNLMLCVLSFIGLMSYATSCAAAAKNIYIAQTTTGNGNGLDCADAVAMGFFNSGSNWGVGSNQIGPGTTVHLCGIFTGTPGANGLTAQGSGTSGSPITILFEAGAIMTAPYWTNAINLNNRQYLIVDGGTPCGAIQGGGLSPNPCNGTIQNTANGTNLTYQSGSVFILAYSCNSCEIRNLGLINNYVHAQCEGSGCDTAAGTTTNSAINFSGSNFLIHDNSIHDACWAVNDQAGTGDLNLKFYSNNIYNVAHGLAIYGGNTWAGPIFFYNNRVHDFQNWDTGSVDAYHADGIHAFGMNFTGIFYIYDNYFTTLNPCCITGEIFLEGGTGSPWTASGGTFYVFNNVFLEPSGTVNGLVQAYRGGNSITVNNTVVGPSGSGGDTGTSLESSNLKFANNVISSFGWLFSLGGSGGTNTYSEFDYQAYGNCTAYNCFAGTGLFSAWQAAHPGWDVHSSYNASLYLNSNGSPSSSSTMVIGQGQNLTSLCNGNLVPLCSDINGNPRPTNGPWDVGAYVYTSGNQPAPPTGLAAVPH